MLLAIDTSIGSSVAVVDPVRGVLAERFELDTRRHAEVIGALIRDVLAEAEIEVAALDGVVVGMGPGPFTGLRVGIAAAQAFAIGADLPLLRVVSHDAVALAHPMPVLVVSDARRREVYWTAYGRPAASGLLNRVVGPALSAPDSLAETLPDIDTYRRLDANSVSAGALGLVALALLAHGGEFASAEPLYLRSPDVTLAKGPKRVSG